MTATTLTPLRRELAVEAITELQKSLALLHRHIAENDDVGEIEPVSRGMLGRASVLCDALFECIGFCKDLDDEQLAELVGCPAHRLPEVPAT